MKLLEAIETSMSIWNYIHKKQQITKVAVGKREAYKALKIYEDSKLCPLCTFFNSCFDCRDIITWGRELKIS